MLSFQVRGEDVGVHISRPRNVDPSSDTLLLAGLDSEGGINKLLNLIHTHQDRKAAIAAAIKAVMALQPRRNGHRFAPLPGKEAWLYDLKSQVKFASLHGFLTAINRLGLTSLATAEVSRLHHWTIYNFCMSIVHVWDIVDLLTTGSIPLFCPALSLGTFNYLLPGLLTTGSIPLFCPALSLGSFNYLLPGEE